ncbi:pectate lyase [Amycolatopsis sp. YIM 10]|uniref:pectate lyase n=1 Tax=Amycolatopsis sp. YIM 10 TaxID=2653857 RepID=UPI0012A8A40A|nr:pectate lyase [Amycolatopsis sp. YIM 10]QFU90410.1 Pectic acid lyase [Amycolatopsis sp. YIM 10]
MDMTRRQFGFLATAVPVATLAAGPPAIAGGAPDVPAAMRRAAVFFDEHLSHRGGYVWSYQPDLARTWGEMAAERTMCWVQPPGTPSVGHSLLDAYHATGDEVFWRAAERTGLALAEVQLPGGGWNYVHDFAGEASLRQWYETVGANGWRLEEFQHYYGNATFDDAGTSTAAQLILRLYLERGDHRFRAALDRVLRFLLKAQIKGGIADGGWPQRFPRVPRPVSDTPWPEVLPSWLPTGIRHGMEDGDYTSHVTFNDDVLGENIKFLLMCMVSLGKAELATPVRRAMDCLRRLQQPGPQAGWGLQHLARAAGGRPAGAPAGARSYEPRALTTHTTQTNVQQLFHYFRLTGDHGYLAGVPAALSWLDSCLLTARQLAENPLLAGRTHPTFVDLGTNQARFVHRFGSNVRNGAYYSDNDHRATLSHYSGGRSVDTAALRKTYDELMALTPREVADLKARSPLSGGAIPLPRYFSLRDLQLTDLFRDAPLPLPVVSDADAHALVDKLVGGEYWLSASDATTNPYQGPPPSTPYDGKAYMSKHVGDRYDTSPYDPSNPPEEPPYQPVPRPQVISTSTYVANMGKLVAWRAG